MLKHYDFSKTQRCVFKVFKLTSELQTNRYYQNHIAAPSRSKCSSYLPVLVHLQD